MEKIYPYLKYLNIVLTVVIISTVFILYVFLSGINIFYAPNYEILLLILPCVFGGIAAGLITPGIRGIMASIVVGALSFCIWSSIYMTFLTIIAGADLGSFVSLLIWIPGTLIIGGILGVIGGSIGFIINISGLWKGKITTE
ncbi:hypothetical protein [Methanobacterium oryzae]|uniref:hypothetical protein n=1 Tax=Methanobacterium oryzae TaxID=69540 RepID=UPI003D1A83D2